MHVCSSMTDSYIQILVKPTSSQFTSLTILIRDYINLVSVASLMPSVAFSERTIYLLELVTYGSAVQGKSDLMIPTCPEITRYILQKILLIICVIFSSVQYKIYS